MSVFYKRENPPDSENQKVLKKQQLVNNAIQFVQATRSEFDIKKHKKLPFLKYLLIPEITSVNIK